MKKIILCCALALTVFACNDDLVTTAVPADEQARAPLTRTEINQAVEAHLQATDTPFDWNEADANLVWSALSLSENHAVIGYQPEGYENLKETIHEIDVNRGDWKSTRDALVNDLREATERLTGEPISEKELLLVEDDGVLPLIEIRILHPGIVEAFRQRKDVRYLEPTNYEGGEVSLRSGSGCSEAPANNINGADYTTVAPRRQSTVELQLHEHPASLEHPARATTSALLSSTVAPTPSRATWAATSAAATAPVGRSVNSASTNLAGGVARSTGRTTAAGTALRWPAWPPPRAEAAALRLA